jgi:CheY-like chemotaxis protein
MFKTDPLRLRQVLINLLGNAVKFTKQLGRVDFTIKKLRKEEGRTLVRFSVTDTGIGIAPEALGHIFEAFEQVSGGMARTYGGSGLGLAIASSVVKQFGSELQVRSQLGEGSEFSFETWLVQDEIKPISEVELSDPTGKFEGKRALVVDDVEINRFIVVNMLEEAGMTVDEAEDGQNAIEVFDASDIGSIDIIFMDIQMPVMDGYDSARGIRALDRPDAAAVPIVALTANAFKDDIDKSIEAGMNSHIAKPVEMQGVIEALIRYVGATK